LWEDSEYGYDRFLRQQKANQLPRNWTALYQQKPTPDTGDYFKVDWLRPYDKALDRDTLNIYGASDYAVTKDDGDYTVHLIVGVDAEDKIYLLDLWRAQAAPDKWVDAFCDLVRQWKPIGWAEEAGQIKAGVGPFLDQLSRKRKAYVARTQFPTRGDKARRAQSIRGRMALDGLYVPIRAPWFAAFRAEMLTFPAGKHDDDQVDALGLIGQLLDKMVVGRSVVKSEEKQPLRMRVATI
jgi:predicted phage terminase large subunit-like protein